MQTVIDVLCWGIVVAMCLFIIWFCWACFKAATKDSIDLEDEYLEEEYENKY